MSETRLGVDVGGTFTDLVALSDGTLVTAKVPSTPRDQSEGVMNAVEDLGGGAWSGLALAHGMTVATNALLERRGARIGARNDGGLQGRAGDSAPEPPPLRPAADRPPPSSRATALHRNREDGP